MLIPGVTAFLGFQLVAVFNTAFAQKLTRDEQMVHVGAMFLTLVALLLLLTPAAYHRQAESGWVSQGFVNLSSRLITGATPLFALGMTLDFYLLVRAVSENAALALVTALVILALTVVLLVRHATRGSARELPSPLIKRYRTVELGALPSRGRLLARALGLALLGPRLVRRRRRDPLRDLVRAPARRLAPLDVLVLALALRAFHSAWWQGAPPRISYLFLTAPAKSGPPSRFIGTLH